MIEFYYTYFKSSYKTKINQLLTDVKRLLYLEKINIISSKIIVLDKKYKSSLNETEWDELNNLINTLQENKNKISPLLQKFINKRNKNKKNNYSFIDTFAGCGGLSLGLNNAGFKPILINEIEPKYLESYYFNHDIHISNYHCGSIEDLVANKEYIKQQYNDIDLIVGGPPCQGFSMANRQRLIDDPRNKLYKYFLELLSISRPKFFIMENVKGMMNKSNEILDNFQMKLGGAYSFDMVLLNAKDYGVPQNRERVFVIGSRDQNHNAKDIIEGIKRKKVKRFILKDALFGLPKLEPKRQKNARGIENKKIGFKFSANNIKANDFVEFINNKGKCRYISNHINRYNNDRDIKIFETLPQGANSLHSSIKDIMPYSSRNHIFKDKYFKLNENEICKTITSHMKMDCNMYIHPNQPRGLSPRESARVQTFPDEFVFMGANNTWYAQIGNAVPVKLAEIIGNEIIKHLK